MQGKFLDAETAVKRAHCNLYILIASSLQDSGPILPKTQTRHPKRK